MDSALPKRLTLIVTGLALALHTYEQVFLSTEFSVGWLLWALVPYALCIVVLARSLSGVPSLGGVVVALAFDLLANIDVFVHPTGSTAALALIFVPLWSALIICPAVMLVLWLIVRRRRALLDHAP